MKKSLIQFVHQIIDSIEIDVDNFQVYSEDDTLPEIFENIQFQSEYLVCIWFNEKSVLEIKKQYESFLHKPINIISNNLHNVLYWFEGLSQKTSNEKPKENLLTFNNKENSGRYQN